MLSSMFRDMLRLLDVVMEPKKLYLVFEYLQKDLKGFVDEVK